jgi:hypothetical protein
MSQSLIFGLIAVGVLVRTVGYFHRASLWGDEAMIALNVASRSFGGLTRPLDYAQAAPVPFLWAERLAVVLGGVNEYALRLLPFVAGVLLLGVFLLLARRALVGAEVVVAVGLAATAFPLIRYAAEVKPYALDALLATGLTLLTMSVIRAPADGRRWRLLGVAGAGAVLASIAAVFVTAGIAAALAAWCLGRRLPLTRPVVLGLLWMSTAALTFVLWYHEAAAGEYLRSYWAATFLVPGSPDWFHRLGLGLQESVCSLNCWRGLLNLSPLYVALTALGAVVIGRRAGWVVPAVFLLPLGAAFAGSVAGRYPLATRLLLFSGPQVILLVAAGLVAVSGWLERRLVVIRARWLLAAFLLPPVVLTLDLALDPPQETGFSKEELRPLIERVDREAGSAPVYVYHRATPAWIFYTTDWSAPDTARLRWAARVAGPHGLGFTNGATLGPRDMEQTAGLARPYRGRLELLGAHSGSQGRMWQSYVPPHPDSGWAEVEARRMRSAAAPNAWMVLADYHHPPQDDADALIAAVERLGGRLTHTTAASEAKVVTITFPSYHAP